MKINVIATSPIEGQKPGTSGLRKKTKIFMEPNYLENFVQSTVNALGGLRNKTILVGGDGRFYNKEAIQIILKMAAANGAAKCIVGQNGLLSTPAASHLIRLRKADGGFILSASHNPGGIGEDFGIKYNISNGGPAPENITDAIFNETLSIKEYQISEVEDFDLSKIRLLEIEGMKIEIVDPVADYSALMATLFDFDKLKALFASGFTMSFDAMHAVTGPYAKSILEVTLGAPIGTVKNAIPLEDFGGGHPDPNPVWAKELMELMMSDNAPDFGAASDGDGDRNMIVGRGIYITPSDSLAVLAANMNLAPGYVAGPVGIARSMPTSAASDRVAEGFGIEMFETPTGWKFFGNLLDDGKVTICGEESAGTGSDHVREKDGLWAVLLWLNILAEKKIAVCEIMKSHWQAFGRDYYSRHDYEAIPTHKADKLIFELQEKIASLKGQEFSGEKVLDANVFEYKDPVDGSLSKNQGIRIYFESGGRAVFRLSGTGTEGATLRIYLEQYAGPSEDLSKDTQAALSSVQLAALEICQIERHTGRKNPTVMT
ncbi:MAG: alpha-D-glucose phosphate-specific phosphoglucomutase [Nitratireductor sp.]